ncbi:hypothetical protein CPC08DRAFT_495975 [Agrocybe pediades]|nr:hypothetical protein CPC08DRAFT_495975 [Agrocybe pediades]
MIPEIPEPGNTLGAEGMLFVFCSKYARLCHPRHIPLRVIQGNATTKSKSLTHFDLVCSTLSCQHQELAPLSGLLTVSSHSISFMWTKGFPGEAFCCTIYNKKDPQVDPHCCPAIANETTWRSRQTLAGQQITGPTTTNLRVNVPKKAKDCSCFLPPA